MKLPPHLGDEWAHCNNEFFDKIIFDVAYLSTLDNDSLVQLAQELYTRWRPIENNRDSYCTDAKPSD